MIKNILNQKEIGLRIKKARKSKKYTQAKLSELIDMTEKNLSQLECGAIGMSVQSLVSLSKALDVSADYILFGDESINSYKNIERLLAELPKNKLGYAESLIEVFVNSNK